MWSGVVTIKESERGKILNGRNPWLVARHAPWPGQLGRSYSARCQVQSHEIRPGHEQVIAFALQVPQPAVQCSASEKKHHFISGMMMPRMMARWQKINMSNGGMDAMTNEAITR